MTQDISYFVQKFAKQMQKQIESVPSAVMKGLTAWEWPGNIRELENFIERAVILTRGKALRSTAHRTAKDRNRDGGRCRREQEASGSQSIQLRT